MTVKQIERYIRRHRLFERGERVLACVSGGADSMAMLTVLHELAPELDIRLVVGHFNHRLRGHEADEDERFVRRIAARLDLEFVAGRKDVKRLARKRGLSLEMAAREARYEFFVRAARGAGCASAATAHTADDHAETIVLRLARGAGGRGLRGISRATAWKGLKIVRPLRDIDRKSIIRFLEHNKTAWREDASNLDTSFLRNRVRHEVIPFLESRLNPQLRRAMLRLGDIMEEENEWLDALALRILAQCSAPAARDAPAARGVCERGVSGPNIQCERLAAHPAAARRRVLRQWLVSLGIPHESLDFETTQRLDRLLKSRRTSKAVPLAGGWIIRSEYGLLTAGAAGVEEPYNLRVRIPGRTLLPGHGLKITASIGPGVIRDKPAGIGIFPVRASLGSGAWRRKIIVRSWLPGDRMNPLGMQGSKKIQDIFVDMRIPKPLRHRIPLFECGGEIIWLPGYRIARGWEVTAPSGRALQLCIDQQ